MGRLVLQGTLRWSSSPYSVACLASWFYAIFLTNPQGVGHHPLIQKRPGGQSRQAICPEPETGGRAEIQIWICCWPCYPLAFLWLLYLAQPLWPGQAPLHIPTKMTIPLYKISHNSLFGFSQQAYRGGIIIRPIFQMKKLKHQVFPWPGAQQRLCLGLLTCIMGS